VIAIQVDFTSVVAEQNPGTLLPCQLTSQTSSILKLKKMKIHRTEYLTTKFLQ